MPSRADLKASILANIPSGTPGAVSAADIRGELTSIVDYVRDKLTANQTYYVRPDGNNANNGLTNTADGAWATPSYARSWIADNIDFNNFRAVVEIADGTYPGVSSGKQLKGGGVLWFKGNHTTPANVILDGTTLTCGFETWNNNLDDTAIYISGMTVKTTYSACVITYGGRLYLGSPDFTGSVILHSAASFSYLVIATGLNARVTFNSPDTIVSVNTAVTPVQGLVSASDRSTVVMWDTTIQNNPNWTTVGINVGNGATVIQNGAFTGSATGKKFAVGYSTSLLVRTDPSTFPGSIAGTWDASISGVANPSLREKLTASRTYYVRTDGNNANNGLADTSGGAWATIQYAFDYIAGNIDLNGFMVTLQLNTGAHAGASLGRVITGKGNIFIKGSTANTTDVVINGIELTGSYLSVFYIGGVKLESSSFAPLVISNMRVYLGSPDGSTGAVRFGRTSSSFFPLIYMDGANAFCTTWSAGTTIDVDTSAFPCGYFIQALNGAVASFGAVAFATTPTWSTAGLQATFGAIVSLNSADAVAGSAVGKRYEASTGGLIRRTAGTGGIDNLPGTVAGTLTADATVLRAPAAGLTIQNAAGTEFSKIFGRSIFNTSVAALTANDPGYESDHTWNNAAVDFRGLKVNANITAAGAGSRLLSLHTDGVVKWQCRPDGSVIWSPPASIAPPNNGDVAIEATSNTLSTIRMKGSDGTVRAGGIQLGGPLTGVVTVSTSAPSGGNDGDVWYQVV